MTKPPSPDSPERQQPRRSHKPEDAAIGDEDLAAGDAADREDDLLDKSIEEPAEPDPR